MMRNKLHRYHPSQNHFSANLNPLQSSITRTHIFTNAQRLSIMSGDLAACSVIIIYSRQKEGDKWKTEVVQKSTTNRSLTTHQNVVHIIQKSE